MHNALPCLLYTSKKTLDPLAQFINACVQYGDGGLLKGKFASKEAEEAFRKALPIIDQAIMEPSGKKRIDLGMEVYRIVESFVDVEAYQKAEKMLSELLKDLGKCIEPVSYTHLDVYKRQYWYLFVPSSSSYWMANSSSASLRATSPSCFRNLKAAFMLAAERLAANHALMDWIKTLSSLPLR